MASVNNDYGSIERIDDMDEGYCLVFAKETKYCKLAVDIDDNQVIVKNDESLKSSFIKMRKKLDNLKEDQATENLIGSLAKLDLECKIFESTEWIYVIVTARDNTLQRWAEKYCVEMQVHSTNAITEGKRIHKKTNHFYLAEHTELTEEKTDEPQLVKQGTFTHGYNDETFSLLPQKLWDHIHIPFDTALVEARIYEHAKNRNARFYFNQHLYLRLLYEMAQEDMGLGGASFKVGKYLRNKYHPLKYALALNGPEDTRPKEIQRETKCLCFHCPWTEDFEKFIKDIRLYYGEHTAFYFVFLMYYTQCLVPVAIIGTIVFAVELGEGTIGFHGSLVVTIIFIIWAVLMNLFWLRKENSYRYKWGMLRYETTQIPRSSFDGIKIVSTVTGLIVEDYERKWCHWAKMLFSVSTMVFCLSILVSVVVGIWTLQSRFREDFFIGTALGFLNSLQIVIMNGIYKKLAIILNDWEGHKLEKDHYNNLVIKRVTFTIVNYNYSLFYIAFWDDRPAYDDSAVRLLALRSQLIILFLMATFYQNFMEGVFPVILKKLKQCCCSKSEVSEVSPQMNEQTKKDIETQLEQAEPLDILDNTAEIIVLHGYITMFAVVFPFMPALAICNNFIELKVDTFNLTHSQRGVPHASEGIGVWKTVISVFNIVAIFSNMALLTYRTDTVDELAVIGDDKFSKLEFFFIASIFLLIGLIAIRVGIKSMSETTKHDIVRQELCQRELLQIGREARDKRSLRVNQ